jgi:hypothetical protein
MVPLGRFVTVLVCRLSANGRLLAASAGHSSASAFPGVKAEVAAGPSSGRGGSNRCVSEYGHGSTPGASPLYSDGSAMPADKEGSRGGGHHPTWRRHRHQGLAAFVEALGQAADLFHTSDSSPDDRLALALRWAGRETEAP